MSALCNNPNHPQGMWHMAAYHPAWWNLTERARQLRNRLRHGCPCKP